MNTSPASCNSQTVSISEERPTAKWIAARSMSLLGHYFQIPADPAIAQMMVADWIEDLQDIPQRAIEMAVTDWRRSSRSRPQPGDIRRLAKSYIRHERPVLTVVETTPEAKPISQERMKEIAEELGATHIGAVSKMIYGVDSGPMVGEIVQAVSEATRIEKNDIVSDRRPAIIARARCMVSYIARKHTTKSFPQIADVLGKDHTSIMAQIERAEKYISEDPVFTSELDHAKRILGL